MTMAKGPYVASSTHWKLGKLKGKREGQRLRMYGVWGCREEEKRALVHSTCNVPYPLSPLYSPGIRGCLTSFFISGAGEGEGICTKKQTRTNGELSAEDPQIT